MPKLPRVTARTMQAALERAGFVVRRQTGSHVIMRHPESRRMAVIPNHPGTLGTGLIASVIKQAGITPDEFLELLRRRR